MRTQNFIVSFFSCIAYASLTVAFEIGIHKDITKEALENRVETDPDGVELKFTQSAIDEVRTANGLVDYLGFLFSKFHFDDEEFPDASQRIIDKLEETVQALKEDPPDGEDARDALGEALHTVQDFYSHSSWVEAKGSGGPINSKLGRERMAKPSTTDFFCPADRSTLVLPTPSGADETSGYYMGFSLTCNPPRGKCAHGEPLNCPFGGPGINKDSPTDPDRGHIKARSLAVEASADFLEQVLTSEGIAGNTDRIRALMGLKGTLAIVIDTTGSMGNDIAGVQNQVAQIVDFYKNREDQPPDFLLVPFGDPTVGPAVKTNDPDTFLAAVNSLSPFGGGDCAEFAMSGLLLALDESNRNSNIFLFTDAAPKDPYLLSAVIGRARAKRIRITAVLTGTCSPIDPAFISAVEETGGQLFFSDFGDQVEQVFNLVRPQLEGAFVTLARLKGTLSDGVGYEYSFPVDSTLARIIVSTSFDGGIGSSEVNITRPDGTLVDASDPGVSVSEFGSDSIFIIEEPSVGQWSLRLAGDGSFTVLVQGNSPVDLDRFSFVSFTNQTRHEPAFIPLQGNPIRGDEAFGIGRVYNPVQTALFNLVDESGEIEGTAVETITDNPYVTDDEILLKFVVPENTFGLIITGTNQAGEEFQRFNPQLFVPQNIKISFDESSRPDYLPAAELTNLTFVVENVGVDPLNVTVSAVDDFVLEEGTSYVDSVVPDFLELPSLGSDDVTVSLRPDVCVQDLAISITVTATVVGTSEANAETAVILASCSEPPTFSPVAITETPSESPSESPTASPTASPMESTTASPSETPRESSTESPMVSPMQSPTASPTAPPTVTPTESPTESPTIVLETTATCFLANIPLIGWLLNFMLGWLFC